MIMWKNILFIFYFSLSYFKMKVLIEKLKMVKGNQHIMLNVKENTEGSKFI